MATMGWFIVRQKPGSSVENFEKDLENCLNYVRDLDMDEDGDWATGFIAADMNPKNVNTSPPSVEPTSSRSGVISTDKNGSSTSDVPNTDYNEKVYIDEKIIKSNGMKRSRCSEISYEDHVSLLDKELPDDKERTNDFFPFWNHKIVMERQPADATTSRVPEHDHHWVYKNPANFIESIIPSCMWRAILDFFRHNIRSSIESKEDRQPFLQENKRKGNCQRIDEIDATYYCKNYVCKIWKTCYGGWTHDSEINQRDGHPFEKICGGCVAALNRTCKDEHHRNQFIKYKCQYCCSLATWRYNIRQLVCGRCYSYKQEHSTFPEHEECKGLKWCHLKMSHGPHQRNCCLGWMECRRLSQ